MTSTTLAPPRALPRWLKTGLIGVAIVLVCWGGAIAYWRLADATPATGELLLALLAAPAGLLLAAWHARKAAAAGRAVPVAGGPAASADVVPACATPPLALLAAALRSPHGATAHDLAAAIADNRARPDLDPELVDDDGFPVLSARCDDAVDAALQEEMMQWLQLNGMAGLPWQEAQWRALTLGTAVLRELAGAALAQLMPAPGAAPSLRLLALLPAGWSLAQRQAAGAWFQHALTECGWPPDGLTRTELPGDTIPATLLAQCAGPEEGATLVLACASCLDQDTVDEWAAGRVLATPARSQGRIPGEGAAGLLLTSLEGAQRAGDALCAQLYPLLAARRDVSSDSARRPDTKRLLDLAERALHGAGLGLADVAALAADTDHRSSRGLELMGLASTAFPQLDATLDVLRTGVATGSCGAVPFLCALALARHAALANHAPALFASNDDPWDCALALVRPPAPAAPA